MPPIFLYIICIFLLVIVIIYSQKKVKNAYKQLYQIQDENNKLRDEAYYRQDTAWKDRELAAAQKFEQNSKDYAHQIQNLKSEKENLENLILEKNKSYDIIEENQKKRVEKGIESFSRFKLNEVNTAFQNVYSSAEITHKLLLKNRRETLNQIDDEISDAKEVLRDFKEKQDSITAAIQRAKQIEEAQDFYRVQINENAQHDIQVLKSISSQLINPMAINKLIWDVYVSRPVTELIKRVTTGHKGGIYKITYINTGESYIGRTTNFSDRWKNHCRTIFGLDGAARSSFHDFVTRKGLWNFTFEILEDLEKENQPSREKYWIEFYDTKNNGLNTQSGSDK